jgi:hypothetical protein
VKALPGNHLKSHKCILLFSQVSVPCTHKKLFCAGALVGPPWSKRQNAFLITKRREPGDDSSTVRVYAEPHASHDVQALQSIAPIDVAIFPAASSYVAGMLVIRFYQLCPCSRACVCGRNLILHDVEECVFLPASFVPAHCLQANGTMRQALACIITYCAFGMVYVLLQGIPWWRGWRMERN